MKMKVTSVSIPVLFVIFNRPDTTRQVFEAIRNVRPPKLYVAADGPRKSFPADANKVEEVRRIATQIDWPCEVKTLFREENIGCKMAVSESISWFFDNEEMGIILEDDCLPHHDFFHFCENLLFRYRSDERIFLITGNNFQNGQVRGDASYYFSKYNHCWGWATWARAWRHYQGAIPFWSEWSKTKEWASINHDYVERRYWSKIFNQVFMGELNSWAYPWTACVWKNNGLTVTPNTNLVTNIGFSEDATHTTDAKNTNLQILANPLKQIKHPHNVIQDIIADKYTFDHVFGGKYLRFPLNIINYLKRVSRVTYYTLKGKSK